VVEVGGPGTLKQSGIAAGLNGEIGIVGALGGVGETVGLHEIMCATRRVSVGDRVMFEEMNRAMEVAVIKPVVDEKVFGFEEMKEAYRYFEKQGFFWEGGCEGWVGVDGWDVATIPFLVSGWSTLRGDPRRGGDKSA